MTDTDRLLNFITYMNMTIVDDKLYHIQLISLWAYCTYLYVIPCEQNLIFVSLGRFASSRILDEELREYLSPSTRHENKVLFAEYTTVCIN
jgi:hypothetical protein